MGKVTTQAQAMKAAKEYQDVQLEIGLIESDVKGKQAAIAHERAEELAKLETRKEKAEQALESYLDNNREELLTGTAKSIDFAGLKLGFRKGTKKLALTDKNTWDSVMELINKDKALKKQYVEQKTVLDKKALQKADEDTLGILGVEVKQEETFFVKL